VGIHLLPLKGTENPEIKGWKQTMQKKKKKKKKPDVNNTEVKPRRKEMIMS
jgi:hypothetical protein